MHYDLKGKAQSQQASFVHLLYVSSSPLVPQIGLYPPNGKVGIEWDGLICHLANLIKVCFLALYDGEAQATRS